MKRKVERVDTSKLQEKVPELRNSTVQIFIDCENQKSKIAIESFLASAGRKKLNTIFGCILRCDYHNSIYKREGKELLQ